MTHLCVDVNGVLTEETQAALCLRTPANYGILHLGIWLTSQDSWPAGYRRVQSSSTKVVPKTRGRGSETSADWRGNGVLSLFIFEQEVLKSTTNATVLWLHTQSSLFISLMGAMFVIQICICILVQMCAAVSVCLDLSSGSVPVDSRLCTLFTLLLVTARWRGRMARPWSKTWNRQNGLESLENTATLFSNTARSALVVVLNSQMPCFYLFESLYATQKLLLFLKKWPRECCYLPEISRCSALYLNAKVAAVFFGQVLYTSRVFFHDCSIEFTVVQPIHGAAPTLVFLALLQHVQSLLLQCVFPNECAR